MQELAQRRLQDDAAARAWYRGAFPAPEHEDRRYLTPAACAAEMGIEIVDVERMALAGELRRIRYGGDWLIEPAIINTNPRSRKAEIGEEG
jgi:hypothetical protein